MRTLSVQQKYSIGGVLGCVVLFILLTWLVLHLATPGKNEVVMEKGPQIEYADPTPRVDPYADLRQSARANGLDPKMVVALVRAEGILTSPEEYKDGCDIKLVDCVAGLAEKEKLLKAALNRKPTASDMLLAHMFGVPEAIRFAQLPNDKLTKEIDEKILKVNPVFLEHDTVSEFRIWLARTVYRLMR